MMLRECYKMLGGDYEDALKRLGSEPMVNKFVLKFLDDGSMQAFRDAMFFKDWDAAFRAVHTLKGVCQNLSFTELAGSSSAVCEAIRWKRYDEVPKLAEDMEMHYAITTSSIAAYKENFG